MRRRIAILFYVGCVVTACAAPQSVPVTPLPIATVAAPTIAPATPTASPAATALPPPTLPPPTLPTPALRSSPAVLPTVETNASVSVRGAGFLTPVELELELMQPLSDVSALRQLVDGVQQLDGIASVRSDGVRIQVRYDSTQVLPARIRARLAELGYPARGGTDVQNPGDAAD